MTGDQILALAVFSFVAFATPGPNNLMLMTSGLNYGFRRTVPHLLGVDLGFCAMIVVVGLGFRPLFEAYPWVYTVMKILGTGYLLYLAWLIARAGPVEHGAERGRPFTFLQAAAFQWVNPKAWGIAIGIITAYVPQQNFAFNVVLVALLLIIPSVPVSGSWVLFGTRLKSFLQSPAALRRFNMVMALLLVASLYPVFMEALAFVRS